MNPVEFHTQLPLLSGRITVTVSGDFYHNCLTQEPFSHSHPKYELHHILHGGCTLLTNSISLPCPQGHFLLLPPHCVHRLMPDQAQTQTLSLLFSLEVSNSKSALAALAIQAPQLIGDTFEGMQRLLRIRRELEARQPAYTEKIQSELLGLLADLARALDSRAGAPPVPLDENRAERIEAYLTAHCFDPDCSCTGLARELNLSTRQLHRLCLPYFNAGFQQLVCSMRMEIAAHRLQTSEISVAALAVQLGYASAASFSAAYKRHYGIPPSQART